MFNIKILRLKDIIKYLAIILIAILNIFFITELITNMGEKNKNNETKNGFINLDLTCCIDQTSGIMKSTSNSTSNEIKAYKSDFYEDILKSQIGLIVDNDNLESDNSEFISETSTEISEIDNLNKNDDNIKTVQTGLKSEVTTNNPIPLTFNNQYGNVKIKNETSHELTSEIMNPNIKINNKQILLFHTHTCESYTSSEKYKYNPTGNFRTTDLNFTVARVGDELENNLKCYGYNVIHDKTFHDYPSYNGSYTHSLETINKILKEKPTDIIFDIHRDAIGSRSDYAPTVKIGEDVAAQIMFVIGSDEGGLWHPNWEQNLKFAIKVQSKAEEMYPGLFKPITLTKYRYNQHCGKYASIIEVGATGNSMEQCLNSVKYLGKILDEVLK